jgi:hypothetical protein
MQKRGVVVLGVSADDIASHRKFADKYGLSFPLLADMDITVSQLYGVWREKNYAGKTYMGVNRETILIDKKRNGGPCEVLREAGWFHLRARPAHSAPPVPRDWHASALPRFLPAGGS